MSNERLYPHEIKQQWESAIGCLPLSDDEKTCIFDVVSYSQTPVSLLTFQKAAALYSSDVQKIDTNTLLVKLQASELINKTKPEHIGTNYPVYYALTHPSYLSQSSNALAKKSRQYFSHLFSSVDENKSISKSTFYNHVLAARDVICAVIKSGITVLETQQSLGSDILATIRSDALHTQKKRLKDKIDTLSMLANKILTPGEKQREYSSSNRQKSAGGTLKSDPWHNKRLALLSKTPQPNRLTIRKERDRQYDSSSQSENTVFGMHDIPIKGQKQAPSDREESSESTQVQRKFSSTLTRTDDVQLVRRRTQGAPVSSLPAITDLARLTDETVRKVLAQPLELNLKFFATLLLAFGLPPQRLMRLIISEYINAATADPKDERPHWCTAESLLCYRLLDGPSSSNGNPANQWVQLALPPSLTEFFNRFPLSERPFRGARGQLNRHLKRYFRNEPGMIPTANRLSASSWLYRRPHAIDDVAASALAGQFGLGLSAPAAYRQLSRNELQHVLDKTLQHLGIPKTTLPAAIPVNAHHTSATFGSAIAQPPVFFLSIFNDIRQRMRSSQAELETWQPYKPFPTDALLCLSQLVSAHELLGWQLSTGARPIGPSSENRIGQKQQWVHDKNSARGLESRVIPVLPTVRDSLKSLHRWHSLVMHVASSTEVVIDDQRTGNLDTPTWLFKPRRDQHLILRGMHWSDISTLNLSLISDSQNNVARHSLASWLRKSVPDAQVDALLGHARHGRMLSSPRSETPSGVQGHPQLCHVLKKWLNACGYQPLNWSRMPWNY